jgi:DNA-binding transcriptional ArsR family regulator
MSKTDESLERLVSTGKCNCVNVKDYAKQLRNLAKTDADPAKARKRGKFYKALGDQTRQRMLSLLSLREMCVCEIITALNMTQPTTSHHLKILEDANLVQSRKEGKWVFYSVMDPELAGRLLDIKM